jgi:hypothetical protein
LALQGVKIAGTLEEALAIPSDVEQAMPLRQFIAL